MVERPPADRVAASPQHGDVQRVDLRLQQDLRGVAAAAGNVGAVCAPPGAGGATSSASRCSVQSPPRSTVVGTPGSGMIEPTSLPSPVKANDVT